MIYAPFHLVICSSLCLNIFFFHHLPIFVDYPDIKSLDTCGRNYTLFLREDISTMEAVAKKFEEEDGVIKEIKWQAKSGDDLYLYPSSNMFPTVLEDGYTPYCEINFDCNSDTCATFHDHLPDLNQAASICSAKSSQPEVSGTSASTLCSFDSKTGNVESKFSGEVSHGMHESSLSQIPNDELLSTQQVNLHRSEVRPAADQQSDDSDSEIFRVKRRSSVKVEKRSVNDGGTSKNSSQVLLCNFATFICNTLLYAFIFRGRGN